MFAAIQYQTREHFDSIFDLERGNFSHDFVMKTISQKSTSSLLFSLAYGFLLNRLCVKSARFHCSKSKDNFCVKWIYRRSLVLRKVGQTV
jgi:hypothetical protein